MRQLTIDDWPLFHQLHTDPSSMKYVRDILDEDAIKAKFEQAIAPWALQGDNFLSLCIVEKGSGCKIGITGFFPAWLPSKQAEVGYLLVPQGRGKGYAFEALISVAEYAFSQFGFHKLVARVQDENVASSRLLEKAGFVQEALLRENTQIGGIWRDDRQFGLLQGELNVS